MKNMNNDDPRLSVVSGIAKMFAAELDTSGPATSEILIVSSSFKEKCHKEQLHACSAKAESDFEKDKSLSIYI
ncbi:hypothetical protein YC2023_051219 [Brassica napus]